MKHLFLISLFSLSSLTYAAADWKVIAETTSCDEKIQIMGKQGEKYVLAVKGEEKTKLFAKDGSAYHPETMSMTEFVSDKTSDTKYTFIQPGYVEGNLPKIDVASNDNKKQRCKMEFNR